MIVSWFTPVNHRDYNAMPASVWIRCLQLIPYLEEQGVHCVVNDRRARADVCVFVRWQNEEAQKLARKLKQRGSQVVFDLCVNYFDETGLLGPHMGTTTERVMEAQRMVAASDAITCASAFIADRAREHHPNVFYLPDSIDRRHFRLTKLLSDFSKLKMNAIWSGVSSKATDLKHMYPLLAEGGITLTVISDSPPSLPGPYEFVPWSYQTFPHDILKGEICLGPRRTDNPYDKGHSHFKIGIFMAQGVPVLASPVPSYIEVIGKAGGGRICASESAWEAALDEILEDRQILREWSQAACQGMLTYSTELVAQKYTQLFESLCTRY